MISALVCRVSWRASYMAQNNTLRIGSKHPAREDPKPELRFLIWKAYVLYFGDPIDHDGSDMSGS